MGDGVSSVRYGDIKICDDAYVGAGTVVMPGVTIGEGALVGANSLVDRNLKPWGIYHGNPVKLVADFEEYLSLGFTPLMCVIDYMNMMRKGREVTDGGGANALMVRDLYTNVCNYLKAHNCTLVTAHQLNRKAVEVARLNPLGAVKRFGPDMLADSTDVQREVDIAIYQHKESDTKGNAFIILSLRLVFEGYK